MGTGVIGIILDEGPKELGRFFETGLLCAHVGQYEATLAIGGYPCMSCDELAELLDFAGFPERFDDDRCGMTVRGSKSSARRAKFVALSKSSRSRAATDAFVTPFGLSGWSSCASSKKKQALS